MIATAFSVQCEGGVVSGAYGTVRGDFQNKPCCNKMMTGSVTSICKRIAPLELEKSSFLV